MYVMKYTFCLLASVFLLSCGGKHEEERKEGADEKPAAAVTIQAGAGVRTAASSILSAYLQLKDALVNYDTLNANKAAATLVAATDSVDYTGTTDSAVVNTLQSNIGTIHSEAIALVQDKDLTEKRRAFSMITENLYPMLRAMQYNESKVYYQMCPMAFNDTETAYWLSDSREINNPYLGTKHPKYHSGMLHCGELKDSINYAK